MGIVTPARTDLPALPHWEATPDDLPGAIRQIKAALRARITTSGRSVEDVFAVIEKRVRAGVEQIVAEKAVGETVWPVIDYADIAAGTVTADQLARLRQRGCLIVRGHFDRRLPALLATLMPDGSPQMNQTRVGTDGERVVINPVQGQRYLGAPCPWYGGRDQA